MNSVIENSTLQFLRELSRNNNRDWFTANKEKYISAQHNIIEFLGSLIEEISKFDEEIGKMEAKKSLFRIYRDTRFPRCVKSDFVESLISEL
ncbi:MAG: DUF2461 family protein [Flavobacteriia bacterium]|nr:DUF2461 family protein [Flavobacteriia bacterium]MBH2024931.1 DUF2461 family protein [Flavobacteriales bacterium]